MKLTKRLVSIVITVIMLVSVLMVAASAQSVEFGTISVAGNGSGKWLNGASWDPTYKENCMTEIRDDVYSITFYDLKKSDNYVFRFHADMSWQNNWAGTYVGSGVQTDAIFSADDNIKFGVVYNNAVVTIEFDLTGYNYETKEGAKFTIYGADQPAPTEPETEPSEPTQPTEPTEPIEYITKVKGVKVDSTTNKSISVSWDESENVEKYWVFVNGMCYNATTGSSMIIEDRMPNTEYTIYVLASFADKSMTKTADATKITARTKMYYFTSSAEATKDSITINWEAEGSTKTWIYFATGEVLNPYDYSTQNSYTISGLKPDTTYYYTLAHVIDGELVKTGSVYAVTTESDELLRVSQTWYNDRVVLDWQSAYGAVKYWVLVQTADGNITYGASDTTFTLYDFKATEYKISVIGADAQGKMIYYYPIES